MNKITSEAQYRELIANEKLTIIVFKTTWCGDCHYINPFMPEVEEQYKEKVDFYEIDRDELPDLCSELNILGIPSFVAFKNSKELVRFVNKLRKTRDEIEQFVNRAIEVAEVL
ncbi:thiol reductase thioredoxin [Paenibacillus montaniterrae]|uniref:Thiol reductase thioredoxin n=1 Tax=Paenibacillus montaniterrae TaxID=429341 RepID=A0A919YRP7_9BACL|nr:thioredoxin family protein [Paenibacillus montaniterrae]GIP15708.1 thiol reductase thioredoxin [Paenibacillus montaniterrae]